MELYNLAEDPGERNDLAEKNPEKKKALLRMLHAWQKRLGAKRPSRNPDFKEMKAR